MPGRRTRRTRCTGDATLAAGTDGPQRRAIRATRDDMLGRFGRAPAGTAVIDWRTTGEYRGAGARGVDLPVERHRVSGHIPGATHLEALERLDPEIDRFVPLSELRSKLHSRGAIPDAEVALCCRIADRGSLLWFALHEVLEHPRARDDDGGWSEYGSLVDAPVSR